MLLLQQKLFPVNSVVFRKYKIYRLREHEFMNILNPRTG